MYIGLGLKLLIDYLHYKDIEASYYTITLHNSVVKVGSSSRNLPVGG